MDVPRTRYARSGEIAIAYQVHGSGGYDLLFSGSTASNIETAWALPEAVRLFARLGRFARVIRFDRRDAGISDPIKDDLTIEAHAADALAVMDAVGARRPVLLGGSEGARSLAVLAATRPHRATALIAIAPSVRGVAATNPSTADQIAAALSDLDQWPYPVLSVFAPEWASDPVRRESLARYIRTSTTPRQAERLLRMSLTSDIGDVLPLVQAPTLVLFPREAETPAADEVRAFADLIPGARYREMPGSATLVYALDPDRLADEIEEFVTGTPPVRPTSRVLATVLFTDLVASTERAARVGDAAWARTLDRHHAVARQAVTSHGGEVVKTIGDGILALFAGPAQGVRCARQIVAEAEADGLDVRTGLHAGEVERGDDVSGLAVHLAARIMGLAAGSQVIVSRTVRDLVIGSELRFRDRGEHEFKGIPDRWATYELRDSDDTAVHRSPEDQTVKGAAAPRRRPTRASASALPGRSTRRALPVAIQEEAPPRSRLAPDRSAPVRPREQRATDAGEAPRLLLPSESGGLDLGSRCSSDSGVSRTPRRAPERPALVAARNCGHRRIDSGRCLAFSHIRANCARGIASLRERGRVHHYEAHLTNEDIAQPRARRAPPAPGSR